MHGSDRCKSDPIVAAHLYFYLHFIMVELDRAALGKGTDEIRPSPIIFLGACVAG